MNDWKVNTNIYKIKLQFTNKYENISGLYSVSNNTRTVGKIKWVQTIPT